MSGSSTGAETEARGAAYPSVGGEAARGPPVDGVEPAARREQEPARPA